MKTIVVLLPMLLATVRAGTIPAVCDIHTKNFARDNPLVLKLINGTEDQYEIDDPDKGDSLLFKSGQVVVFACPGTEFKDTGTSILNAECIGRDQFEKEDGTKEKKSFDSIKCNGIPKSVLKEDGLCGIEKSAYAVGFEVEDLFVKVMDICFDENIDTAVYVKHKVSPNIDGSQKHFSRPQFKADKLFANVDAAHVYNRAHQLKVFSDYSGSQGRGYSFINKHQFLSRGHLAPKADYVYGAQQTATFYYANAAPQWQSFNADNWGRLEAAVRRLAVDRRHALTVYTGTVGIYRVDGAPVYLARDKGGRGIVPVPLVFWKVVVDERSGQAVAFAGLNDPHGEYWYNGALNVCNRIDMCDSVFWVSFSERPRSGLMYCCTVDDLRLTVKELPPISNVTILSA